MYKNQDPLKQISLGNAWYLDDQFTKQYSRPGARAVIEHRWTVFEDAIRQFLATYPEPQGRSLRILDAGCGDGINLVGLNDILNRNGWSADIFGTDYNPLRVERASKLGLTKDIVQSSLNVLPYTDDFFDIILCNHVLEHISADIQVLKELKRVLHPKAMLVLGVPNEGCLMAQLRNKVFQRSILKSTDHVNFYTKATLSSLLVESGYNIKLVNRAGFFLPHFAFHYLVSKYSLGRAILNFLGRIWPSQSTDLIIVSIK